MHCASLGEFEQGRALLELFRTAHPEWNSAVSFFSPSGYEHARLGDTGVGRFYLPLDRPQDIQAFVEALRPSVFVSVRYEFWMVLLEALRKAGVPRLVVSAHFRPEQWFFKKTAASALTVLRGLEAIGTQDEASHQLLVERGFRNSSAIGNGRVDRVAELAERAEDVSWLADFKESRRLFIGGSVWPEDLRRLLPLIDATPEVRWLIVPHEVEEAALASLLKRLGPRSHQRWTQTEGKGPERLLILDAIGWLARCYRYADWAYIGGGYGEGVHNVLEPAAFGCPLFFGPRHRGFPEAQELMECGAAWELDQVELEQLKNWLSDPGFRAQASERARAYVERQKGASLKALKLVERFVEGSGLSPH